MAISWTTSMHTTDMSFLSYETITLKLYYDIIEKNNVEALQLSGRTNIERCTEEWERIVAKNAKENNNREYEIFLTANKEYAAFAGEHVIVHAMLIKLAYIVDKDAIAYLKKKGYKIVMTKGDDAYAQSLIDAQAKAKGIVTKLRMKRNEIASFNKEDGPKRPVGNFQTAMANLIANLKTDVRDDITLARYNEYIKILKQREAALKKNKK